MALVEGCKHELEIEVPVSEVDAETERVVDDIAKKAKLPGFRPGKAPASLVRTKFESEIRKEVLDNMLPKAFRQKVEESSLDVVGRPNVTDVHFHKGEPLRFKIEFEVAPTVELGEYKGIRVEYLEPEVSDDDVNKRLDVIRDQKAQYINQDPRPIQAGDFAVITLKSVSGVEEPVSQDELMLHIGDPDTLPAFTENLTGLSPGDEKSFSITYPEDYGQEKLAGKTVEFHATVKAIRLKELPEANDEFARDLGDFQTLDEFKETLRRQIFQAREHEAQQAAKEKIATSLAESHTFAVPQAYIDKQIDMNLDMQLRQLVEQGIDPRKLNLDWAKIRESQRERAATDVKASLILGKIADREAIAVTNEELDREVQRIAKQQKEPVAAVRQKLEKNDAMSRIAGHIRTEKVLTWLFENARKEAPTEAPAA